MFKHNLKVSFRNLWKYKMQTAISIIGLAVGFTCFSLATLWMRYETSYDSFHKNANQLYVATEPDMVNEGKATLEIHTAVPIGLKETFPEVKEATSISRYSSSITIEDHKHNVMVISVHSNFMAMFDIKILEGSLDFTDDKQIAITKDKAKAIYGDESPIGKKAWGSSYIAAVVSGYSNHSNFPFDILDPFQDSHSESNRIILRTCVLELLPNVDVEAFKKKLHEHKGTYETYPGYHARTNIISLIPLTKLRAEDPTMKREIKFQHIKLFAWSGILVILCALFNYLTLFVSRFKIRGKELALRVVCGASLWSLFKLLLIEFFITLLAAVLLGLMIMNIISPAFQKLSEIQMNLGSVYIELGLYILFIILLTILLFAITLAIFKKFALNTTIRRSNNQLFRKISIVIQLVISIGFVFCTAIMIKQIHYLHNSSNIGFEYKNMASFSVGSQLADAVGSKMKQIPEITDVVTGYSSLIPVRSWGIAGIKDETGKDIEMRTYHISKAFAEFYGLQLIAGEMITGEESDILINESALKFFGWNKDEAVGKHLNEYTVKGVIKNIYNSLPTVEVVPFIYFHRKPDDRSVIFKYTNRTVAEAKIRELIEKDFPEGNEMIWKYGSGLTHSEDAYEEFFKSEKNLIMMLNIMSAVCVLISIFGFFSLVSLSCEEKRKEIAIRKVNGADIHDIIAIFFKEYSLLLAIGAAIAFPLGYYIMKGWLEQYMNQTTIDAWIYAAILLAFATIIVICVGWRVYKTSRENPADVVKSE